MDEATRAGWPDILVESIARGVDGVGLMLKGRNDVLYIKGLLFQSAEWAWVQLDDNQHDEAELWCSIGPFADCMNVRVSEIVCVLRERKS